MGGQESNQCDLADKKCAPCSGGVEPLKGAALKELFDQLPAGWEVIDEHHLEKAYKFKNFSQGLDFVNKVGQLAEEQGHHPDIFLAWGKVKLKVWTHKINGLHESDFIFTADQKTYNAKGKKSKRLKIRNSFVANHLQAAFTDKQSYYCIPDNLRYPEFLKKRSTDQAAENTQA